MRLLRAVLAHVPVLAALGCGGGDLVLPSDGGPARIVIVKGDGQTGSAGAALDDSLVVRVTDAQDRVISGLRVAFTLSAGGGEVSPDTVVTDGAGLAGAEWILGAGAGAQAVDAKVVGEALTVRFTAAAGSGAASRLVLVSGDDQSAAVGTALADSLVVRVEDAFGNPVAGVSVGWTAGVGEVSPATATSDGDGRAAARRILGAAAGEQTATASADGLAGSPVTFTHTAVPGTAASLVLISGSGQTGPPGEELPEPLIVRVVDQSGNGIPAQAVTWVVAAGGGSVDPGTSVTDGDGLASTRWTLGSANGANTLNAVVSGVGVVGFTATASSGGGGGPAPATRVELLEGDGQTADVGGDVPVRPAVRVTNDLGQPVAGFGVTFVVTGGGGSLTGASQTTNSDGVARVGGWTLGPLPGTNTLEARAGSLQGSPVVFSATAVSGPDHLEFRVQPGDVGEDEEFSPPVEVVILDATGRLVPLSDIEIRLDLIRSNGREDNGRLKGDRSVETRDGVAVFPDLTVDREGEGFRLRASAPGLAGVAPVLSAAFEVD